MGCGYLNLYPMIASEKMAMGFHSFYPHGIGGTDLSQSHSHQIHSHHDHVRLRKHFYHNPSYQYKEIWTHWQIWIYDKN